MDDKPKIIQILIAPDDAKWQNTLMGLGSDGVTYYCSHAGKWEVYAREIGYQEEKQ